MLALKMEQSTRCTSCGTAEWEWEDDPAAYEAAVKVCLGCMHKDLKREDRRNNGNKPGETITLVPKGHTVKDPRPRLKPRTRSRSQ